MEEINISSYFKLQSILHMFKLNIVNDSTEIIEEAFGITEKRKSEHSRICAEKMKGYHPSKQGYVPYMMKELAESSKTIEELVVFAFSLGFMVAKVYDGGLVRVANNSVGEMVIEGAKVAAKKE